MRRGLLDLLVPPVCPACDRGRDPGDTLLCEDCALGLAPCAALGDVRTAVAYEGTGLLLVRRFKFDGRRDALAVLAERLARRARGLGADAICFVPRPLERLRDDGRDPAWELARVLGRALGLRVLESALERTRTPALQRDLPLEARRANVRDSFRARPQRGLDRRTLLVVDDVVTTGATLAEAGRALRTAGAARVIPLAAAGTPPPGAAVEAATPPVL